MTQQLDSLDYLELPPGAEKFPSYEMDLTYYLLKIRFRVAREFRVKLSKRMVPDKNVNAYLHIL